MGAFGEKLRKQREERGVTLDAISNTTKISTRMLRALEDEHFDQLPGGVFNKGFVRAYARQVGLNEEEAITDYLAALSESQVQSQNILPDFRNPIRNSIATAAAPPAKQTPRNEIRTDLRDGNDLKNKAEKTVVHNRAGHDGHAPKIFPGNGGKKDAVTAEARPQSSHDENKDEGREIHTRSKALPAREENLGQPRGGAQIPWGKVAAALLVVAVVLAFWGLQRQNRIAATAAPATTKQNPTQADTSPAIPSAPSNQAPLKIGSGSTIPVAAKTSSAINAAVAMPLASTHQASASIAATTTAPISISSPAPHPPVANAAAKIAVIAKSPATFTVLIRAEKTSWVSILADGKPVAEETLIAPAHTSVRATREIVVRTGNAAGISFLLNGKEIPAQGDDGEVKIYAFDGSTVRVLPQTQSPASNQ